MKESPVIRLLAAGTAEPVLAGQPARNVYLQDLTGHLVTLTAYRGQRLLLCLYRSPDCPQCALRLLHLVQAFPRLAAHQIAVVVVFAAPAAVVRYQTLPLFPPFPVVADPEERVFQGYGVRSPWWSLFGALRLRAYWGAWRAQVGGRMSSGRLAQRPAEILIGPEGLVQCAYYGQDIGDYLNLDGLVGVETPALHQKC